MLFCVVVVCDGVVLSRLYFLILGCVFDFGLLFALVVVILTPLGWGWSVRRCLLGLEFSGFLTFWFPDFGLLVLGRCCAFV